MLVALGVAELRVGDGGKGRTGVASQAHSLYYFIKLPQG